MKSIEKNISHFVENQFPDFYKESGPEFISFMKAYYEWLEDTDNVIYEARSLPQYRDIDTTVDDFIVYFKEKYLKNIQFDTATNKISLIKNAISLYRSKGTERSIDLFFKLIYGTDAEIYYPADNILRVSDGIWEKPLYLEISSSQYNVDYIGKQVVGSLSGAKAFVERYIRRRTNRGYVNILYISGITGEFINGEVIGITVNSKPSFNLDKRATLIGSVTSVTVIDKGRDFKVGDLVNFSSPERGLGGIARVESVSNATGIIDFLFIDGGWGYTLDSESIVSEKVITATNIQSKVDSIDTYSLFENAIQPLANITFNSANGMLSVGDVISEYDGPDMISHGHIISVTQVEDEGEITISPLFGSFTPNTIFLAAGNTISFTSDEVENKSIYGTVMGIPDTFILTTDGIFPEQSSISQSGPDRNFAIGIVKDQDGNKVTVSEVLGSFKTSRDVELFYKEDGIGTISTSPNSNEVIGIGTDFEISFVGLNLYSSSGDFIGVIETVLDQTTIKLNDVASVIVNNDNFSTSYTSKIVDSEGNSGIITNIESTFGVYNIRKEFNTLTFDNYTNPDIIKSQYVYQYIDDRISASGTLVTGEIFNGEGIITIIEAVGNFQIGNKIYTEANTASADLISWVENVSGGDFVSNENARIIFSDTKTSLNPLSISFGSGASLGVGSLTDTETIFIGTDLLDSQSNQSLNTRRKIIEVSDGSLYSTGQYIQQGTKISSINPSLVDRNIGVLLPASMDYEVGDKLYYIAMNGNTEIDFGANGSTFQVHSQTSSGWRIAYPENPDLVLNAGNYPEFLSNPINEDGHYFTKISSGLVYEINGNKLSVDNVVGSFEVSDTENSNVYVLFANTINSEVVTAGIDAPTEIVPPRKYMSIPLAAGAYGFPKMTSGYHKTPIYDLLSFNSFTIGTIASLQGVDPGSDYNVNPYVLINQPYISAFNRKDFVIEIENSTGEFVVGERISQTLPALTTVDIQVDSGIYPESYVEITTLVNSEYDILDSDDFILVNHMDYSFNANTEVENSIVIPNNTLEVGDMIRYYTNTGNTEIGGLSNNNFYYIESKMGDNIRLSSIPNGPEIVIVPGLTEFGHHIIQYKNTILNDRPVRYTSNFGAGSTNTPIEDLQDDTVYYTNSANTSGYKLSNSLGNIIQLTGHPDNDPHIITSVPGFMIGSELTQVFGAVEFNDIDLSTGTITSVSGSFMPTNGMKAEYIPIDPIQTIPELVGNGIYYIINADSSNRTFQISDSPLGSPIIFSAPINITDVLYFIAEGNISGVYVDESSKFIRVNNVDKNDFSSTMNPIVYSISGTEQVEANILGITTSSTMNTAKGIIKPGSNTSVLYVKRLSFENHFIPGETIFGETSGTTATLISAGDDDGTKYPIGLNAVIEASAVIANGQIDALQVIDSGFGFANGETVQYTSQDGSRSGTIRVNVSGRGIGQGYYRSSKGFLSSDMYIHDGDYYQEYSYEVISKMNIDKYASMFKQVMHMAGTKFFGSVRIIENDEVNMTYIESSIDQESI